MLKDEVLQSSVEDVYAEEKKTEEKLKAEEALRKSENKFRTLLENLPQKIFLKDKNSVYVSCNENYARDLKIRSDEIAGKTDYDFYPKELAEKYRADDKRIMESGKTEHIEEEYIQDGQKVFVHTVKTPVKDENSNVVGVLGIFWDITERKKMEDEIKSLARFPSENPNPVLRMNREGIILYANHAGKTLLQDWEREVVDQTPKFWRDVAVETLNNQSGKSFDTKLGMKVYSIFVTPVEGAGYANVYGIDITERKKAEEKIRKSAEEWSRTFDAISDLVFILDRNFSFVRVNNATCDLLKKKPEELIGKHCFEVLHGTDKPLPDCPYKRTLVTKKAETQEINDPNVGLSLLMTVSPLFDDNGEHIGCIHVAKDVTERKKAEEALRESEEKLRNVFIASPDAITVTDLSGNIVDCNQATLDLHGYQSREDLIGKNALELIAKKDHEKAMMNLKKTFEQGSAKNVEFTFLTKDVREFPAELSASAVRDASGKPEYFVAITKDVTERKNMEKQLKEYSEHLEEKVEKRTKQLKEAQEQLLKAERLAAIGEVATMVGHDLRNPLQAVANAVYFLKDPHTTVDSLLTNERYKEYLDIMPDPIRNEFHEKLTKTVEVRNKMINTIDESIEYADKIVSDLQDLARTKEPEPIKIDLESLIQETLSGISIPKNVKISIKHDQRLSKLYVDPNQLRRVFANLTTNAIQAMENGGTLTISTKKTEGFVEVSFKDTGVGISEENMEKLFTPLFTTKAKGMGLGLPICKKFVELHGGSIEAKSQVGNGTTFTVKLPIPKENGGEKT